MDRWCLVTCLLVVDLTLVKFHQRLAVHPQAPSSARKKADVYKINAVIYNNVFYHAHLTVRVLGVTRETTRHIGFKISAA